MTRKAETDVLVIGSGIAGAAAALELGDAGFAVTLVTRARDPRETNTYYAQGGIVFKGKGDSPERLARDGIAGGDPGALIADLGPAATLDDDEPADVGVRVRLDPPPAREGELRNDAGRVAVDDLAGHARGARRPLRPTIADAEAADLDGHRPPQTLRVSAAGGACSFPVGSTILRISSPCGPRSTT